MMSYFLNIPKKHYPAPLVLLCESCGIRLKEHFEVCQKCNSEAYHEVPTFNSGGLE